MTLANLNQVQNTQGSLERFFQAVLVMARQASIQMMRKCSFSEWNV